MFAAHPPIPARRNTRQRGQWSLVGLIVSLAIIAILSAWYYSKILKPQAGSHNGAPAAEQQAYGTACGEYVSQMNMASTMYKQEHEDHPPQSFDDLKKSGGFTNDMLHATGCQFQLDPATGVVSDIGGGRAAPGAPLVVLGAAPAAAPAPPPPAPGAPLVLGSPASQNAPAPSSVPAGSGGDGSE